MRKISALSAPFVAAALTISAHAAAADPAPQRPVAPETPTVFRLASTGIMIGAGPSLQVGNLLYPSHAREDRANVAFSPYVVLSPAYWVSRSMAVACAADGTASSSTIAGATNVGSDFTSCLPYKVGIVVARPLTYDATTTIPADGDLTKRRTVHPLASLALGFSPNAWFTTYVGWTFATVTAVSGRDVATGTLTFGVGANLDAAAAIFTK